MEQITLTASKRETLGKKVDKIRKADKLPAVLYGHGLDTLHIEIDQKEFQKTFKKAGENTLVSLMLGGQVYPVLIQEVQYHYIRGYPIHVDFYVVRMDEKLKAHIPLHFIGESVAVKTMGGILVKNLSEIEVECLPGDLPQSFEIDISKLNTFEDMIRVSDLIVSDKVKVLARADELIVAVAPPRSEEELKSLEETVTEDVTQVEGVIKPEGEEAKTEAGEEKKVEKTEKVEKKVEKSEKSEK
jgi:large subunit ribosomal protein L25